MRRQANTIPVGTLKRSLWRAGYASEPIVAAVVVMVSFAVAALGPVMLTVFAEPKLKVGAFWAPAGLEVIAAVRVTLPVKPPEGVRVIMETFPVVAPAAKVTDVPATVNEAGMTAVTDTMAVAAAEV